MKSRLSPFTRLRKKFLSVHSLKIRLLTFLSESTNAEHSRFIPSERLVSEQIVLGNKLEDEPVT